VNKDLKRLETIYEDMLGYNTPQYGSPPAIAITPTGTESAKSKYVEVPDTQGDRETDDEDTQVDSPIKQIFNSLKDIIRKFETKQKEKMAIELDKKLK
jgi:hypothetical protein